MLYPYLWGLKCTATEIKFIKARDEITLCMFFGCHINIRISPIESNVYLRNQIFENSICFGSPKYFIEVSNLSCRLVHWNVPLFVCDGFSWEHSCSGMYYHFLLEMHVITSQGDHKESHMEIHLLPPVKTLQVLLVVWDMPKGCALWLEIFF